MALAVHRLVVLARPLDRRRRLGCRRDPGRAAVAAPEVPARLARARGHGPRRSRSGSARPGRVLVGLLAPQAADPLPDRALQLRDRGQRAAGRALPGLGPGRRQHGAHRARASSACCSTRATASCPTRRSTCSRRRASLLGGARRFAIVLPAALVYYATVASADNWAGAVCNLGRYFMPIAPLVARARRAWRWRAVPRGGAPWRSSLMLAGWTGLLARLLFQDPHAANDGWVLLAKSTFADGHQYVPNLFIRELERGRARARARGSVWLAMALALAVGVLDAAVPPEGKGGDVADARARRRGLALVLTAALVLERWPSGATAPRFGDAIEAGPGSHDVPRRTRPGSRRRGPAPPGVGRPARALERAPGLDPRGGGRRRPSCGSRAGRRSWRVPPGPSSTCRSSRVIRCGTPARRSRTGPAVEGGVILRVPAEMRRKPVRPARIGEPGAMRSVRWSGSGITARRVPGPDRLLWPRPGAVRRFRRVSRRTDRPPRPERRRQDDPPQDAARAFSRPIAGA